MVMYLHSILAACDNSAPSDCGFCTFQSGPGRFYDNSTTNSKHISMKTLLLVKVLFFAFSLNLYSQSYHYVKHDAAGSNTGTSWTDAFTGLQTALTAASSGDFIWVAAGTYTPTAEVGGTGNQFKAFQLKNGVTVYGGFEGNEDPVTFDLDNRDFISNETTLSGDLGGGVNAYHVFRHVNIGLNNTAVLDGFTISGSKADGSDLDNKGGGMLNSGSSAGNGSSPTIRNCVFKNNAATQGGAMYNSRYSNPVVSGSTFSTNTASQMGGAVYNIRNTPTFSGCTFNQNNVTSVGVNDGGGAIYNTTSVLTEGPTISNSIFTENTVSSTSKGGAIFSYLNPGKINISNSTFRNNQAQYGGALFHNSGSDTNRDASDVKISNSTFEHNSAEYGGAIFSDRHHSIVTSCVIRGNEAAEQSGGFYSRYASSKLINTLVSGNKSAKHGGGVYFNTESPEIINTTITGNYSGERGGGISMINGSTVSLENSILWGNGSPEGSELWVCSNCTTNIDYSLYDNAAGDVYIATGGAVNATNSSNSDPIFLNHSAPLSGNTPNTSGNYLIKSASPAVDAGLNTYLPVTVTTDLRGRVRIIDGNNNSSAVIDMGAYEYDPDYCNSTAPTLGNGAITNPYQISTPGHLCWISQNSAEWDNHYIQTSSIDASDTQFWDDGEGFMPIGNSVNKFTGTYNGQGFSISNLSINRASSDEIGLFGDIGQASGYRATIQNLSLVNASVTGKDQVGLLAGRANRDIDFINCHVNGSATGNRNVGGMVGDVNHSNFLHCSSSATVGVNNQGDVRYHGGLIGVINGGSSSVKQSFATGNVTGASRIGGLVGAQGYNTTIENCFATGNVYPTVSLQTSPMIGGLVGEVFQAVLRYSYSTGVVDITGLTAQYGGLVGAKNTATPFADVDNFWDTQNSGLTTSELGSGKTTTEMHTQSTFTNWDFQCETANGTDYIWGINTTDNNQYPFLSWQGFASANCPVWNGSSTDWATASNWSTSAVPADYYSIVIPSSQTHYPVLDQNRIVGNLQIATGASLTIPPLKGLTVDGILTNDAGVAGIVVQSDATGTGSLIHSTTSVYGTVERYIVGYTTPASGWHFLSSPVASQAISAFHTPNTGNDLYKWNEPTDEWINRTDEDGNLNGSFENHFVAGRGYLIANNTTGVFSFTGELNADDLQVTGLTNTNTSYYKGWHLLGNPFSSAIKFNQGTWNKTNIGGFAQIWNESTASYKVLAGSQIIPAQNGFMVYTTGSGSLTIPTDARLHSDSAWYKNALAENEIVLIARDLEGQTAQETIISFNPDATEGFDLQYDSYFLAGFAPRFYSISQNELFALNSLPVLSGDLTIPLGFLKNNGNEFTIELIRSIDDKTVYLIDQKSEIQHRLTDGPYNFSSEAGDNANRFLLKFGAVGIDEATPAQAINIWVYDNLLYVNNPNGKAHVEVFDLMGRNLYSGHLSGEGLQTVKINQPAGLYLIRITSKGFVQTFKVSNN